jgi:hypothetical protein
MILKCKFRTQLIVTTERKRERFIYCFSCSSRIQENIRIENDIGKEREENFNESKGVIETKHNDTFIPPK